MQHRRLFLAALLLLLTAGESWASGPEWRDSVLKIEVLRADGRKEIGSGVLIAPERLLTNCHVVRDARQIKASQGNESWPARIDIGDSYRDLCLLDLPGHPGKPPAVADPAQIKVGQSVYAVGFSGGEFTANPGQIKGLFTCDCGGGSNGDKVIQTSARFDPGASGGGLFNAQGELVGVLTFKSHEGGIFHFAIPIGWLKQLGRFPGSLGPFWENPSVGHAYFLAACDLSAHKRWRDLSRLTQEWVREEPDNPEAWMASGRAHRGLKNLRAATADFRKALELDPTHAEAVRELQQLEQGTPPTN